jgi:nucleotide-binding universal stress UspA family protein
MVRSILVPLDGSTFGEHALPLAASLARRAGATLHLVHVHQIVPPETIAGIAVMDAIDVHTRQDEQAYLADVARRVGEAGPVSIKTALMDGAVAHALCEYAEQQFVDLVVMSTHGRGALGRFWLGSVADDLMRELPRPVLLVRPHEGKPDLGRQPELKSIVVPLDGTPLAEQVIEPALELGKLFNAEFTLLRVNKPVLRPSYLPDGSTVLGLGHSVLVQVNDLQREAQEDARKYLNGVAAKLAERGFAVQTRVVINEEPAAGILQEARPSTLT